MWVLYWTKWMWVSYWGNTDVGFVLDEMDVEGSY